jgi:hypothetical protein
MLATGLARFTRNFSCAGHALCAAADGHCDRLQKSSPGRIALRGGDIAVVS